MAYPPSKEAFHQAFGAPSIPAAPMHFKDIGLEGAMARQFARNGAGWYLGRMFYLLGEGLEALESCVQAWSFLLPPALTEWVIIGFNAYGEILVMDEHGAQGTLSPVGALSPLTVSYLRHPDLNIFSLLADWLPNRKLGGFVDTSVYRAFLESSGRLLDDHEILGIRTALPLGGEMQLANFRPMSIFEYYQTTAPAYAKAYEQFRSPG